MRGTRTARTSLRYATRVYLTHDNVQQLSGIATLRYGSVASVASANISEALLRLKSG